MVTLLTPDQLSKYPARPAGGDPRMAKIAIAEMIDYLDNWKLDRIDMVDHAMFSKDPLKIIVVSRLMANMFAGHRVLLDPWTVDNSAWIKSTLPEQCQIHPGIHSVERRANTLARFKVPEQRIKAAFIEHQLSGLSTRKFLHHLDHLEARNPFTGERIE